MYPFLILFRPAACTMFSAAVVADPSLGKDVSAELDAFHVQSCQIMSVTIVKYSASFTLFVLGILTLEDTAGVAFYYEQLPKSQVSISKAPFKPHARQKNKASYARAETKVQNKTVSMLTDGTKTRKNV